MTVKSKPTFERTEIFKFDTDYLWGRIGEDHELDITTYRTTHSYRQGETRDMYLAPWQVATLAKVLTKAVKFYQDNGIDTDYPDWSTDDDE